MNTQPKHPLASRKLWVAIAGVLFSGLAAHYPRYKPVLDEVLIILVSYIGAEAVVDTVKGRAPAVQVGDAGQVNVEQTTPPTTQGG